jgi:hypothetical protein
MDTENVEMFGTFQAVITKIVLQVILSFLRLCRLELPGSNEKRITWP